MPEERETMAFGPPAEPAVLEDPTGRRARHLRRAGRVVFVLFLAWLVAIVLGGLGLGPVSHLPFSRVLRPSHGPPPAQLPAPLQPSLSDLLPAAPAPAPVRRAHGLGRRTVPPGLSMHHPVRGKSASAPGRTRSKPRGKSATAPGRVRKTTTAVTTITVPNGNGNANGHHR